MCLAILTRRCRYTQLFNVNGDSPSALDLSVHYPLLQMVVYFDWIKSEDVVNGTARPCGKTSSALGRTHMAGHRSGLAAVLPDTDEAKAVQYHATGYNYRMPRPKVHA